MANQFYIKRVAFGNFTYVSTATNATNSVLVGGNAAFIPKGAIVTGIKLFCGGAVTNGSNFENATFNIYCGGQALGTSDRKASEAFVQTVANTMELNASGLYVSVGGPLAVYFASSSSKKTGIAFDADVYVEYLYCADRDVS